MLILHAYTRPSFTPYIHCLCPSTGLPFYALIIIILLVIAISIVIILGVCRHMGSVSKGNDSSPSPSTSTTKGGLSPDQKSAGVAASSSSVDLDRIARGAKYAEADIEQPLHRDEPEQVANALRIQNSAPAPTALEKPRRNHEEEVNAAIAAANAQVTLPDVQFIPDRKEIKAKLREYETAFESENGFKPRKKAEWGEMWGASLKYVGPDPAMPPHATCCHAILSPSLRSPPLSSSLLLSPPLSSASPPPSRPSLTARPHPSLPPCPTGTLRCARPASTSPPSREW